MTKNDATELAYKNGYEAGVREMAERLRATAITKYDWNEYIEVEEVDTIANELIGGADE